MDAAVRLKRFTYGFYDSLGEQHRTIKVLAYSEKTAIELAKTEEEVLPFWRLIRTEVVG